MPYDPSRSCPAESMAGPASTPATLLANPFLQLVDPPAHRELVKRALRNSDAGRLITPLSRMRHRAGGSAAIDSAWDEDLADDAA